MSKQIDPIITRSQAEALIEFINSQLPDISDDGYCCASDAVDDLHRREEQIMNLIKKAGGL